MNHLSDYIIQFAGLSIGVHQFDFEIDEKFFATFEDSEIEKGKINAGLQLDRKPDMLIMSFSFNGLAELSCDRCLDPFNFSISGNNRLIVKFGESKMEETEDIIVLPKTEHKIDIRQYLYEFIVLLLPLRRVHPDDESGKSQCNPEFLRKLDEYSKNNNTGAHWDNLKKLI